MKKLLLVLTIFFLLPTTTSVMADDILEGESYWESVDEILWLYIDGSINPVFVNSTKDYDYIAVLTIQLDFSQNNIDFDHFGDGNGTNALINGTQLYRNGVAQFVPIKTTGQLMGISRWTNFWRDDVPDTGNHLSVVIDYTALVGGLGLKITNTMFSPYIMLKVQDNIPDYCDSFYMVVSGSKWIGLEPDFQRDWLEDMFVFDNPLKFIALIFTIPAIMIFTWEPVGIMVGVGIVIIELIIFAGMWRRFTER